MLLRCKVGAYAGQVQEYPDDIGRSLLDRGLASLPEEEQASEEAPAPLPADSAVPRKQRRA